MDGFESTRAIRAWEKETGRPAMPIIALTAHVVGSHADAWKTSGMDGVLHKPFTLAAMARMLETHLMGRTPHADRRIAAGAAMPSVARHEPLPEPDCRDARTSRARGHSRPSAMGRKPTRGCTVPPSGGGGGR
jgi:two-component system sensor histidine kinase BarA